MCGMLFLIKSVMVVFPAPCAPSTIMIFELAIKIPLPKKLYYIEKSNSSKIDNIFYYIYNKINVVYARRTEFIGKSRSENLCKCPYNI